MTACWDYDFSTNQRMSSSVGKKICFNKNRAYEPHFCLLFVPIFIFSPDWVPCSVTMATPIAWESLPHTRKKHFYSLELLYIAEISVGFCCVLFSCGHKINCSWSMRYISPYHSGLLHWHWYTILRFFFLHKHHLYINVYIIFILLKIKKNT